MLVGRWRSGGHGRRRRCGSRRHIGQRRRCRDGRTRWNRRDRRDRWKRGSGWKRGSRSGRDHGDRWRRRDRRRRGNRNRRDRRDRWQRGNGRKRRDERKWWDRWKRGDGWKRRDWWNRRDRWKRRHGRLPARAAARERAEAPGPAEAAGPADRRFSGESLVMRGACAWRQPARPAPALSIRPSDLSPHVQSRHAGVRSLRRGQRGLTPDGAGNSCLPKCGDGATPCVPGSSCHFLGVRTSNSRAVGVCRPDCGSGADACGAGSRCDVARRTCVVATCPAGCPSGSTCTNGVCVPAAPRALYADCTPSMTTASGCASNLCIASGTSPGFCGLACNSDNGDSVCGVGGVCWSDASRTLDWAQISGELTGAGLGQFATVGSRTAGVCVKKCATGADCPAGTTCAEWNGSRACLFRSLPAPTLPATGTGVAGQLCRASSECASGSCAIAAGYLDGVCEKAPAAVCPANTIPGTGEVCLLNCAPAADLTCPGSHICDYAFSTSPTCAPGLACRGNLDCATGYTCDPNSAQCVDAPSSGSAVGSPCPSPASCASGFCRTNAGGFPEGYCTAVCQLLPDRRTPARRGRSAAGSAVHRHRFVRLLLRSVRRVAERVEIRLLPRRLRVHPAARGSAGRLFYCQPS